MRARAVATALGAIVLFGAARSGAASPPPVRLAWTVGAGAESCIDRQGLADRVRARLGRDPFSEGAALAISGGVSRDGEFYRAVIDVRDGAGHALGHRELRSPSSDCAPLGDAVVLAVALTIDPEATVGAAESFSLAPGAQVTEVAGPACPVQAPPPEVAPPCPAERAEPEHAVDVEIAAGVAGAVGLLPGAAPGAFVGGRAGHGALSGLLGVSYFPEKSSSDPRVDFGLTFASADGCYGFGSRSSAELLLCAGLELGAIHAVVTRIAPVTPGDQLWLSAEFGPRFVWNGFSPLRIEAALTGVVPLKPKDFGLVGQPPLFSEAHFGAIGAIGVGIGSF